MNDAYDNSKDDKAALEAVTRSRHVSTPCLTCTLPEDIRKIIEDDRKGASPHSFRQLSRFLETRGLIVGEAAIGHHFRKGHAR